MNRCLVHNDETGEFVVADHVQAVSAINYKPMGGTHYQSEIKMRDGLVVRSIMKLEHIRSIRGANMRYDYIKLNVPSRMARLRRWFKYGGGENIVAFLIFVALSLALGALIIKTTHNSDMKMYCSYQWGAKYDGNGFCDTAHGKEPTP